MNQSNGKTPALSLWPLVAVLSEIATREPAAPLVVEQAGSEEHQKLDPISADMLKPLAAAEIGDVPFTGNDERDTE